MNKSRLRQNRLKELLKHDNIYAYTLSYSIVMMLDTVHQALSMGSFPMLNRVLKPNHSRILCLSLSLITWAISFQTELEAADLTPNNLVVERIGNGTTALSSAAAEVHVLEYSPSGSLVQTLSSQFTSASLLTDSGTATSNGYLNSYNGYLAVSGMNSAVGTASVAGTNAKAVNILGTTGNVESRTLFPTGGPTGTPVSPFSGNNFRSVIATSATTFYASGTSSGSPNTGGPWYFNGTNFTQLSTTITNIRNSEIYNNQYYVSSASGAFLGVSSVGTGLATTSGQTTTLQIGTGAGSSPYGFVIFDKNKDGVVDLAYIADDRIGAGGGIQRWDLNSSNVWVNAYSLLFNTSNNSLTTSTGTGIVSIRGLTGSYDALSGTASLFATTSEVTNNRLVSLSDTGSSTPSAFNNLALAGSNYVFRGVDFTPVSIPVPEPSSWILVSVSALLVILNRRKMIA